MNPINDEIPAKDSTDIANKALDLNKTTDKLVSGDEAKNVFISENEINNDQEEKTEITHNVNIRENKDDEPLALPDDKKMNTVIYEECSDKVNKGDIEKNTSKLKNSNLLSTNDDLKINEEVDKDTKGRNKEKCAVVVESISEDDSEDYENVEDVEIPGDEEVDEIIVPDEAEAENLTDDKDNEDVINRSLQEDMQDEEDNTSKCSEIRETEIDESLYEEQTSKSSDLYYKDQYDKKCFNNNIEDDSIEDDTEPELVSIEDIKHANSQLGNSRSNESHLDEDTTSQAIYDPLNCINSKEHDNENTNRGKSVESENKWTLQSEINENEVPNEEDDDEVQFVETRNSPICIESDDEDGNLNDTMQATNKCNDEINDSGKRIITTATTTVSIPRNITVKRTSARKSTAKVQQNQSPTNSFSTLSQAQTISKKFSYLQKATSHNKRSFTSISTQNIVDCIELLDSSDEETTKPRSKPTQHKKPPQKRTLLAAKKNYYKNNKTTNNVSNLLPSNILPHVKRQPKKPSPPPLPPPTPQSNFLNAVQLQPAAVSGQNPRAFSALLSNKSVIIPNAFYGNPPSFTVTPEIEQERRYVRWLENFINQFSKPQFIATHSCLVFLQRALKYKDFVRIKGLRANMNNNAQSNDTQVNTQLMTDLKTIFMKNTRKITNYGRRFCELTCSVMPGKAVTLMAHRTSGKVTLKTCNVDLPKPTSATISSATSLAHPSINPSMTRKRQLDEDEDEYTPDKTKSKTKVKSPSENGDDDINEVGDDRKRSLRTKRTKRIDNSFSYNEDDLLAEYEIDDEGDEKLVQVEIQRKIEQKRLEAQQQRQQQVKSFENAFIQAFAGNVDDPTTSSKTKKRAAVQRIRLQNTTTATVTNIKQYTANNDAEDLLQATWIENLEKDETQIISDDDDDNDEPKEHRIYKQQLQEHYSSAVKLPPRYNPSSKFSGRVSKRNQEEIITGDDCDTNVYNPPDFNPTKWPQNIDPLMHVNGKHRDKCIICSLSCQRLVHHYVNEHRGCEVYNSRLSPLQLQLLKQGQCSTSHASLYKNGQCQYEAFCIFCQKMSRFMLPYWYQHFTMHTGEYAYRCIGCGIRKPTRSLLTQHQAQGCQEVGGIAQDYSHDSKSLRIEAKICSLCNYVQLHRSNIVKHLHTQHNIKQILPKHIQTIVLINIATNIPATSSPSTYAGSGHGRMKRSSSRASSSHTPNTYICEDDNNDLTYEEILPEEILPEETQSRTNSENNYYNYIPPYMQAAVNAGNFSFEDVDACEDLSYMICGMLDVQMNPDAN